LDSQIPRFCERSVSRIVENPGFESWLPSPVAAFLFDLFDVTGCFNTVENRFQLIVPDVIDYHFHLNSSCGSFPKSHVITVSYGFNIRTCSV
jgi:hypothetical protein